MYQTSISGHKICSIYNVSYFVIINQYTLIFKSFQHTQVNKKCINKKTYCKVLRNACKIIEYKKYEVSILPVVEQKFSMIWLHCIAPIFSTGTVAW